jgi:hypothetical protein
MKEGTLKSNVRCEPVGRRSRGRQRRQAGEGRGDA